MARQEYVKDGRPGISQYDIQCTTTSFDYLNEDCADRALQGNLPGLYTHTKNDRD